MARFRLAARKQTIVDNNTAFVVTHHAAAIGIISELPVIPPESANGESPDATD